MTQEFGLRASALPLNSSRILGQVGDAFFGDLGRGDQGLSRFNGLELLFAHQVEFSGRLAGQP